MLWILIEQREIHGFDLQVWCVIGMGKLLQWQSYDLEMGEDGELLGWDAGLGFGIEEGHRCWVRCIGDSELQV